MFSEETIKGWINEAIEDVSEGNFKVEVITDLDSIEEPNASVIYFVPKESSTEEDDIYLEYVYVNDKFELIGTSSSLPSGDYITREEVETIIKEEASVGVIGDDDITNLFS